jgi:hypothetical protein
MSAPNQLPDGSEQIGPPIPGVGEALSVCISTDGRIFVEFDDEESGEIETLTLLGNTWVSLNHGNA